jgi:hypothetical protein
MKEVEAKVYGPTEALKFLTSSILNKPAPLSRNQPSSPRLLSFTAPPSATASLAGSVVNGNQPLTFDQRVQDDLESQQDEQADHARRSEFQSLRHVIGNMITNLDEKNVVMAEANRALAQQLARLDSVMPHIENEISEESRLGSLTHWAYQDNRTKKQTTTSQSERNRRDVAATSSLAAAAAAVHDQDIAAARGEARRETKKTNRAQAMDSDFDDRPTKRAQTGKSRKNADAEPKGSGLGIANGIATAATTKRRKFEKAPTGGAPAMERSASGMSTVTKAVRGAGNTTPRSTPAVETTKKKGKPGPAPGTGAGKKRYTRYRFLQCVYQLTRLTETRPSTKSQTHQDYPTPHLYLVMHNYNPKPFPDLLPPACGKTRIRTRRRIYSTRCFQKKKSAVQHRPPTTNLSMAVPMDLSSQFHLRSRQARRPRRAWKRCWKTR